jgi:glycine hydroxymethyltransferase
MRIAIGSDHGGFDIKQAVRAVLEQRAVTVDDRGTHNTESTDYPDFGRDVAERVAAGRADRGVLVCTTGIGMSMMANKVPGVRAALCLTPRMAEMSRLHNDANILVLPGGMLEADAARAILDVWLDTPFSNDARHVRRVGKVNGYGGEPGNPDAAGAMDPEARALIRAETERQAETLDLIASENHVSRAVRVAQASVLTNKYAEGYPGKRWYNGCRNVDGAERLALERVRGLFGAEHANVQPHCGSAANMAVYFAALQPGDTILSMSLAHGGHLTHGHDINFSGRLFRVVHYGVDPRTERLDMDAIGALARAHNPKLIVAGASAYPRALDFAAFRAAADAVGAALLVDMAHIAGLVASGTHADPVPHAEFVTATTHKTLRGPRGGLILCREAFAETIDRQVFPGLQGGPEMHTILAKAVCFHEALQPAFKDYGRQVVRNAAVLAEALQGAGFRLVSGGTDNHLMLVDLTQHGLTGKDAAAALEQAGIVANKNCIPFDTRSPFVTSGVRLGTPAVTTRGMKDAEMKRIAAFVSDVIKAPDDTKVITKTRAAVRELAARFPVP